MPQPDPRHTALHIIHHVMAGGCDLPEAIAADETFPRLAPRDRAFARRLCGITLKRHGEARALLAPFVKRMPRGKNRLAASALLMGAAELAFGEGAAHAVVNQCVGLVKAAGLGHLGGLVNVALRRVAENIAANEPAPRPMLNLPAWLGDMLIKDWGVEETIRIAEAAMTPPPLDLTLRDDAATAHWARELGAAILSPGSLRLATGTGEVAALAGYKDGAWWVQDAAAALPVRLLGDIAGKRIADLCAAPGGKTAQLCAGGGEVIALDQSAKRIARLEANMQRLGFAPRMLCADALTWHGENDFDCVLIDAPCSATGTLRRHPDILTRTTPPDFKSLNAIQKNLLAHAATLLRPGGIALYATCSLLQCEGEAIAEHIAAPLTPHPFTDSEIAKAGGDAFGLTAGSHMLRVMPQALRVDTDIDMDKPAAIPQGSDGFFIARFIRNG